MFPSLFSNSQNWRVLFKATKPITVYFAALFEAAEDVPVCGDGILDPKYEKCDN